MSEEGGGRIIPISVSEHMKSAYIDYSMSVIVSRALPDVRDGLKPVHRRVLFGMHELGLEHNKPYKKSARIVGEVLGKFHPHGDSSVYDTMVRMAQPWSLRYTLVDGQGNFGSVDGDSPAAMRYTEARLSKIAGELLTDLEKGTVDFRPNFDESLSEPVVLPARIPNLLINGASGIAVGMATNIPPHNITEIINGIIQFIDNNDITFDELIQYIKAPDFPTGGIIYGYNGVLDAFHTGRGRIVIRAKTDIEVPKNQKEQIIVTELPYLVNKAAMIMKTAELVMDKVIDGISDIRDESDRTGMRIVYELKKDANAQVVLNNLFKYTQLQSSFSVNLIALVRNKPYNLTVKDCIKHYVDHRHEVVLRRTRYELEEAKKRAHILEGLLIALDNLDAVIKLIRESRTPDEAKTGLIEQFQLSDIQAKAILEMRLQRLTGLERDKIKDEFQQIMSQIDYLNSILDNQELRMQIIKDELIEIREKYGDERRTEIIHTADDLNIKDIIPNEEVVITISSNGYIKRTNLADFRTQRRGGRGSRGASSRNDDFIQHIFVSMSHNYMLLFSDKGKCYWLNVYEIPEGEKNTKGRSIQNLMQLDKDENIKAFFAVDDLTNPDYIDNTYVIFATKKGLIKKTPLKAYSRPRKGGIIAININEGDELIEAMISTGNSYVMLGTRYGQAIRFPESKVRSMGRNATGVIGIRLSKKHLDDEVIGLVVTDDPEATIMVNSDKGYGKRSNIEDYRITNRGGKGIRTFKVNDKTGKLIAIGAIKDDADLMIINKSGITIRLSVKNIRTMGRATQGVKLIKLNEGDEIASITRAIAEDEIDENDENIITEDTNDIVTDLEIDDEDIDDIDDEDEEEDIEEEDEIEDNVDEDIDDK